MSPRGVTGRHVVKKCGEDRTDAKYNANGGNNYIHKQSRSPPVPYLRTETDPVSETLCFPVIEFRMMDKVQKPSINECYTPSSEPYRVYVR
jgi:hypothetical protein